MRLMFDCVSAAKLPIVIESSAESHTIGSQPRPIDSNEVMKMRRNTANAAAFGPAERNAETGAGAPWYTSGDQIWKGALETLNASPTNISAADIPSIAGAGLPCPVPIRPRIAVRFVDPDMP